MAFAIRRRIPTPVNGSNFHPLLYPTFFLLQLNPTCMKLILHLVSFKNIIFKSSYNLFKIDILRLLRLSTAILSHVQSHFNYYTYNKAQI